MTEHPPMGSEFDLRLSDADILDPDRMPMGFSVEPRLYMAIKHFVEACGGRVDAAPPEHLDVLRMEVANFTRQVRLHAVGRIDMRGQMLTRASIEATAVIALTRVEQPWWKGP